MIGYQNYAPLFTLSYLTLTGRLPRIRDKQNNSCWTARNYEILSMYSEIIITTFWYHLQPLAMVA